MRQTVAEYTIANPAGIEHGTLSMRVAIEQVNHECGACEQYAIGVWLALRCHSDGCTVVSEHATQDDAARAAIESARNDNPLNGVDVMSYIEEVA